MRETAARTMQIVTAAAIAGERCPPRGNLPMGGDLLLTLAAEGFVKIEVYGRNYRVVHLLKGEHAGLATRACPHGSVPYIVVDAHGTHRQKIPRIRSQRRAGRPRADLDALDDDTPQTAFTGPDPLLAALRQEKRT